MDTCKAGDVIVRAFVPEDADAVIALWTACGLVVPWNDPRRDIERKLRIQADMFLVAELDGALIGAAMAGYEGHRGWINYLAVDPEHRRKGVGRRLMAEAEIRLRAVGCPKINLQVRSSNRQALAFYEKVGFKDDEVVSLGKRLESDE